MYAKVSEIILFFYYLIHQIFKVFSDLAIIFFGSP